MSLTLKEKLQQLWADSMDKLHQTAANSDVVQSIIQRTFLWMAGITFIVFAVWYYMVSLMKTWAISPSQYTVAFWTSMIGGLALVFVISWFWEKMNYATLAILAVLFAILEGIGLSGVLAYYSAASVINAFAGAAVLFLVLALYGYFTKSDLTKFGTILVGGLIAMIILSLINILFIHSSSFELVLSIVGLLIFLWLVAWDLQTLKIAALSGDKRLEIVFGISLYLDFINIFLELLRIFGSSDN